MPTVVPTQLYAAPLNITATNISWLPVDCREHNGRFVGFIVTIIGDDNSVINISSRREYAVTEHIITGIGYNISVAFVNDVGNGPFSGSIHVMYDMAPLYAQQSTAVTAVVVVIIVVTLIIILISTTVYM